MRGKKQQIKVLIFCGKVQLLSALREGGTVGMFHYLAHGMNLVRVMKDNVQLILWKDHNA